MDVRPHRHQPLASLPPAGPSIPGPAANDRHGRQKRVACRECRQAKVRCDGLANGSRTCIRCSRLSLECQVDLSYKRVNKRLKINELAEEMERLRSAVGHHPPANNATPSEAHHDGSLSSLSQTQQPALPHGNPLSQDPQRSPQSVLFEGRRALEDSRGNSAHAESSPSQVALNQPENVSVPGPVQTIQSFSFSASTARSLEHVVLSKEQIGYLFQQFFEHYHPYLDILDPSISPDDYYRRSPILFWAIISVAVRRYEQDATLLATLNPCVTRLMWNTISTPPHSRFTIQAVLLLCTWSFPTNSMSTDNSFILISIAKSASMQLGLHRPEIVQDFMRVRIQFDAQEFQEAVKTWVGCYITAQSVTTTIGQPSLIPRDWTIDRACELNNKYSIPDNLRHHLLIYKFIARVNGLLAENDRSPKGYSLDSESYVLMEMLEQDFVDLERQISDQLTATNQIRLTMACLQLRTYYFFMPLAVDIRKQGLLKAYTTALTLISRVSDADVKWDFIKYAPNGIVHVLTVAAILLMKIISSSYSRYVDVESGKSAFNSVLSMHRRASVEDNDLRGRAGKILAQLWSVHQSLAVRREQEPTLNIKTRLGASVLHDSLWMWREEFGGQRATASVSSQSVPAPPPDQRFPGPEVALEESGRLGVRNHDPLQSQADQNGQPSADTASFNNYNMAADLQDIDWIWDMGFPSLLPIDVDSYESNPSTLPPST